MPPKGKTAKRRSRSRRQPPRRAWLLLLAAAVVVAAALYYVVVRPVPRPSLTPPSAPHTSAPPSVAPPEQPATEPKPPPPEVPQQPKHAGPTGHLSLVIDDLGRSLRQVHDLDALGIPLTYSVLPFESHTPQVVALLAREGKEVLCHLPMQPAIHRNPGPGALLETMTPIELVEATRRALLRVPNAVGINNHMGSELTQDPVAMRTILGVLAGEKLFFLDSRTSPASVGYKLAREIGLPTAQRQVFLDPDQSAEAIRSEFHRFEELARRRGAAIAIAHPHPTTLAILREEIPQALAAGFDFVPVSFLLDRPSSPAR